MPRGRPKAVVAPCQFCSKQFKRREHLQRHERTHTQERPFACDCGLSFTRRDLLARHIRLSHPARASILPSLGDAAQAPAIFDASNTFGDLDLFWSSDLGGQDMLPTTLFDRSWVVDMRPGINRSQTTGFSRFSSCLPSLDNGNNEEEEGCVHGLEVTLEGGLGQAAGDGGLSSAQWPISPSDYEKMRSQVQTYSEMLPSGCSLPSRDTLARYLNKYFTCVQEFSPFIHVATFTASHTDAELLLSMAALGSLYLFERVKSCELYLIAKAIVTEKKRRQDLQLASDLLSRQSYATPRERATLSRMKTLALLVSYASWSDKKILPDALSICSDLVGLVRESGISESDEMPQSLDWTSWVTVEERRRTLLAAFVLSSQQSMAFNTPPLLLDHEIGLFLPGSSDAWRAKTEVEWEKATQLSECRFQDAIRCLLGGKGISCPARVSSYSNYLLIHGLLQRIYIARKSSLGFLQPDVIKNIENALHNWQLSWELTHSSLLKDPLAVNEPFGLSAIALLRLAHIRLKLDLGQWQSLVLRDPRCITNNVPKLVRSPSLDSIVLHAAHALSIPVRLGVQFIANTKTFMWSIEHSISSLECAALLQNWLMVISADTTFCGTEVLREAEHKLLAVVTDIIQETSLADTLNFVEDEASCYKRMATTVAQLWAYIFQGVQVLEIDSIIGIGLQLLAGPTDST